MTRPGAVGGAVYPRGTEKSSSDPRKVPDGNTQEEAEETMAASGAISPESSNLVDWESESDPQKPMNWPMARKTKNIVAICYSTFLTLVSWLRTLHDRSTTLTDFMTQALGLYHVCPSNPTSNADVQFNKPTSGILYRVNLDLGLLRRTARSRTIVRNVWATSSLFDMQCAILPLQRRNRALAKSLGSYHLQILCRYFRRLPHYHRCWYLRRPHTT